MRTSAAVPPGARLRRRKSSSRLGSDARWTLDAAASEGAVSQAACQRLEERDAGTGFELAVAREDFASERHPRGFAAAGQEILAELGEVGRALLGDTSPVARAVDERAAAFRDGLQHIAEG